MGFGVVVGRWWGLSRHTHTHTHTHTRMTQSDQSPEPASTGQAQALVGSRFSSGRKQSNKSHDHQRLGAFLQEAGARCVELIPA